MTAPVQWITAAAWLERERAREAEVDAGSDEAVGA